MSRTPKHPVHVRVSPRMVRGSSDSTRREAVRGVTPCMGNSVPSGSQLRVTGADCQSLAVVLPEREPDRSPDKDPEDFARVSSRTKSRSVAGEVSPRSEVCSQSHSPSPRCHLPATLSPEWRDTTNHE